MSITGIEKLEFGVDDLNHSAKFMRDFGLTGDASGRAAVTVAPGASGAIGARPDHLFRGITRPPRGGPAICRKAARRGRGGRSASCRAT